MDAGLDDIWANNSYELNFSYGEGSLTRVEICLLFKKALEEIIADPTSVNPTLPLTINVVGLEWAGYLYQVRNRQLPVFFLGAAPDYADPDNYASPLVRSTGTFPSRVGLDGSFGEDDVLWDTSTVDGWIDAAAVESEPATRISLYAQIQEAIVNHCAYLWCSQDVEFHVERYEMNGYVYNPKRKPYFFHYYKSTAMMPFGFSDLPIEVLIVSAIIMGVVTIVILKVDH